MTVLFAVKVSDALTVWHTPEQYQALLSGVDVEASWQAVAPLEVDIEDEESE